MRKEVKVKAGFQSLSPKSLFLKSQILLGVWLVVVILNEIRAFPAFHRPQAGIRPACMHTSSSSISVLDILTADIKPTEMREKPISADKAGEGNNPVRLLHGMLKLHWTRQKC